jgi:transcriptional regulator with XRE-family HTH domain
MFIFKLKINILDLHKEIKRIRKSKDFTQKGFALKIGITPIHYCGIENGRKKITLELLQRISIITDMQLVITFIDK